MSHYSKPVRKLPDPAICRAEHTGFGNSVDCLVKPPFECPHAARLSYATICHHPDKFIIVARTKAEKPQA